MAKKPTLRIRFTLNRQTGDRGKQLARATNKFAETVVTEVGLQYATSRFNELKSKAQHSIERAVRSELNHLVMLYKKFMLGKDRRPHGNLTTKVQETSGSGYVSPRSSVSLSQVLPPWQRRSDRYLRDKSAQVGHTRWFEHTGYLKAAMTPGAWEEMFGPVRVTVTPTKSRPKSDGAFTSSSAFRLKGAKMRFGVATIRAGVFGNLTPSMLPALATGDMKDAINVRDGRRSGLLGLVAQYDEETAYHLGQNPSNAPYRPTLEPFLSFAITRSLPEAVFARLSREGISN